MGMRIAIVDDRREDAERLRQLLEAEFARRGFAPADFDYYESGEALLAAIPAKQYDLLLLDIYMQAMNGIETARRVREQNRAARLVFITTSNDFAAESYALRADYYTLKPVTGESVARMLDDVDLSSPNQNPVVTLPGGIMCPTRSILFTEYSNHQITLHLENGQTRRVWMAQADLENLLDRREFVTCTKGIVIGLRWVDRLDGSTVVMKDGRRIPISRGRKPDVKQAHADYLFRLLWNDDSGR